MQLGVIKYMNVHFSPSSELNELIYDFNKRFLATINGVIKALYMSYQ